uniref:Collagen, type VI, alpha 3 n=1 Tax=Cyprinus carpio TaxID=7962 RepID=A0A8C2FA56_CYPCA
ILYKTMYLFLCTMVDVTTVHTQRVVRDIVFLVDGSNYVGNNQQPVLDFITEVPLDIGFDKVRVSVVQHSERPSPNFYLNTYRTKDEVLRAVSGLTLAGGRSLNTGIALTFMKNTILSPTNGGRAGENVPQFLIVLTGGRSRDSVGEPAVALKTEGVVPFGVGEKNADPKQIEAIAHNPSFAFNVKEFSQLSTVQERLKNYVNLPDQELKAFLEEGKTIFTLCVSVVFCMLAKAAECISGFFWVPSDAEDVAKDIVFILDDSDSIKSGFGAVCDFVQRLVEKLNVEERKYRISVVQYSDNPLVDFYLKTYSTKKAVIYAINGLTAKGGRNLNTGAALQYVRDHVFTAASGSRHQLGVPQLLIVMTGGGSSDDVAGPAEDLKNSGVLSIAIGIKNAVEAELQSIAFSPRFIFNLPAFGELLNIHKMYMDCKFVCKFHLIFIPVELDAAQRDIVFILDGSDDTRDAFKQMCQFVQRVVDKLNIGPNRDRVSVVQYSREPQVHFYLNTHATKQDILNSIESVKHQGGSPLNTGRALDYTKKNIFIASSGSRILEGAPQVLVLVTGGRSQDDVRAPASALKKDQIVTFSIGNQNADVIQLQEISYTPGHTLTVPQFDDLQTIEQKLCHNYVVFLIDGTDETKESFSGMQNFVQTLVQKLNVAPNKDRVSVVQYSDDAAFDFLLNTYSSSDDVINNVKHLIHKGGRLRHTGAALQYVKDNLFTAAAGSRLLEGVPQVLILLNSGRSNDEIRGPVKALKDTGVISFSIGTTNADTLELQTISHQPNYFFISDFESILDVLENILALINRLSNQRLPTMTPQVSGKRKLINFIMYVCTPATGSSVLCIIALDNLDRVAVVQYSRDPTANFYLSSYSTKKEVLNSIRSMRHKSGRPLNTGAALLFIKENIFTQSSGSRRHEGVPQILYLFSGGRSGDDVRTISQSLRENNIKVITIGTSNSDTLEQISHCIYCVSIESFKYFCLSFMEIFFVLFIVGQTLDAGRNIVFLIDGSDDASDKFTAIREFVASLAETFDVGKEKDQIAVVQFSNTAAISFNLNTYSSTSEVADAVRNLKPKGGRPQYIGQALQFVRDSIFTPSVRSRQIGRVSQNLVLVAGGRSRDSPRGPANALKSMGVAIFAIGSRLTDPIEMEAISSKTDYAIAVSDFHDLKNVHQSLMTKLMGTGFKRDIAFLVDGSDSTRRGFPEIRDFLYNIITNLSVGVNNDRISIIQYSNVAVTNFYLNSFLRKEDVLNAVKVLSHKGGRPLNTGSALQYVKENIFISASGSRHKEGIPQILILLTSGKSRDSISEAASALKKSGVLIYGIGGKYSDSYELHTVSSENKVLSLADFSELPKIQTQLLEAIKAIPSYNKKEFIGKCNNASAQ